jgi:hypothetical protein
MPTRGSSWRWRSSREEARDLGVRYVIEGSARRAAGRVRINVQLIDAIGGGHLWAERLPHQVEGISFLISRRRAVQVERSAAAPRCSSPPSSSLAAAGEAVGACTSPARRTWCAASPQRRGDEADQRRDQKDVRQAAERG